MLQAGLSPVRVPDEVNFFNLRNSSSRTMALGSTQPLTKMSTRNLPWGKKWPASRADKLAAICAECLKMWEPQPLATLRASTACTGITLPLPYLTYKNININRGSKRISGKKTNFNYKLQMRIIEQIFESRKQC
jgi:hypothetical protein